MAVNPTSWKNLPLADRDQPFDADDAIARMVERANIGGGGGDAKEFGKGFLWRATDGDPLNKDSYRLPIADVIDGNLALVPHAVYAAAALLSGAHGGLPNVPDEDKQKIRDIISEIYIVLRDTYNDPRIRPPWDRGRPPEERSDANMNIQYDWTGDPAGWGADQWESWRVFSGQLDAPYGKLAVNEMHMGEVHVDDDEGDDCPEGKHKMPDGTCMDDEEMPNYQLLASGEVKLPRSWFADPLLSGPTPLTVDDNGRVYGHLATWRECHTGIGNACVTAPRSVTNYSYFRTGEVVCDDGTRIAVGKITLGAGHADPALGYLPAAEHYDSSATCVAIAVPGEDKYGIWLAGAAVPGLDDKRLAEFRRSCPSGDWRRVGGNLELVAALLVNVPGFPVVRASANTQFTLLAAGMVTEEPVKSLALDEMKAARLETLRAEERIRRLAVLKGE